jgi:hypothetical protein
MTLLWFLTTNRWSHRLVGFGIHVGSDCQYLREECPVLNAIPHLPLASLHAHGSTKDPTPDPALRVDSTCYINYDQVTPHNGTEQASHLIEKIPRGDVRGEGGLPSPEETI